MDQYHGMPAGNRNSTRNLLLNNRPVVTSAHAQEDKEEADEEYKSNSGNSPCCKEGPDISVGDVCTALCQVVTNAVEVLLASVGMEGESDCLPHHAPLALYRLLSRMNHSCRPNAVYHWSLNHSLTVRVLEDVPVGAPLTVSYLDALTPRHLRQPYLAAKYKFSCNCPRCLLPNMVEERGVGLEPPADFWLAAVAAPLPDRPPGSQDTLWVVRVGGFTGNYADREHSMLLVAMPEAGTPAVVGPSKVSESQRAACWEHMVHVEGLMQHVLATAEQQLLGQRDAARCLASTPPGLLHALDAGLHHFHHLSLQLFALLASAAVECATHPARNDQSQAGAGRMEPNEVGAGEAGTGGLDVTTRRIDAGQGSSTSGAGKMEPGAWAMHATTGRTVVKRLSASDSEAEAGAAAARGMYVATESMQAAPVSIEIIAAESTRDNAAENTTVDVAENTRDKAAENGEDDVAEAEAYGKVGRPSKRVRVANRQRNAYGDTRHQDVHSHHNEYGHRQEYAKIEGERKQGRTKGKNALQGKVEGCPSSDVEEGEKGSGKEGWKDVKNKGEKESSKEGERESNKEGEIESNKAPLLGVDSCWGSALAYSCLSALAVEWLGQSGEIGALPAAAKAWSIVAHICCVALRELQAQGDGVGFCERDRETSYVRVAFQHNGPQEQQDKTEVNTIERERYVDGTISEHERQTDGKHSECGGQEEGDYSSCGREVKPEKLASNSSPGCGFGALLQDAQLRGSVASLWKGVWQLTGGTFQSLDDKVALLQRGMPEVTAAAGRLRPDGICDVDAEDTTGDMEVARKGRVPERHVDVHYLDARDVDAYGVDAGDTTVGMEGSVRERKRDGTDVVVDVVPERKGRAAASATGERERCSDEAARVSRAYMDSRKRWKEWVRTSFEGKVLRQLAEACVGFVAHSMHLHETVYGDASNLSESCAFLPFAAQLPMPQATALTAAANAAAAAYGPQL